LIRSTTKPGPLPSFTPGRTSGGRRRGIEKSLSYSTPFVIQVRRCAGATFVNPILRWCRLRLARARVGLLQLLRFAVIAPRSVNSSRL
jgi:hypothetical protein